MGGHVVTPHGHLDVLMSLFFAFRRGEVRTTVQILGLVDRTF